MRHLALAERETVVTFNEADKVAEVYTHSKRIQQHFEKKLGIKPISDNGWGGRTYQIDKKRIPLPRKPRKLSPKARKMIGSRLLKARLRSGNNVITITPTKKRANRYITINQKQEDEKASNN